MPPVGIVFVVVVVVVKAEHEELKCSRRAPGYFTLIDDRSLPASRNNNDVPHTLGVVVIFTSKTKPLKLPSLRNRGLIAIWV